MRKTTKWMVSVIFVCFFHTNLYAERITIAASANLGNVMNELKRAFIETHRNAEIGIVLGSSGKLTAQIRNGAPYGLFLSADTTYPEELTKEGFSIGETKVYAKGSIVLFSAKRRDLSDGIAILKTDDFHTIAVANPKTAPYGKAAVEALKNSGIYDIVSPRLIYAESVSQCAAYVMTAADIGIVAKSSLFSPGMRRFERGKNWIDIDPSLYRAIEQGAVLLKGSEKSPLYGEFFDFLFSAPARSILEKYGYTSP